MEAIKSELQRDILDIANSVVFKETIFSLVRNWIGNKITDSSATISTFIEGTIKREFSFGEEFYCKLEKSCQVWEQPIPCVIVAKGDKTGKDWYGCHNKEFKIQEIKMSKNFVGYPEPVPLGTFPVKDFTIIKFENEDPRGICKVGAECSDGEFMVEIFGVSIKQTAIAQVS